MPSSKFSKQRGQQKQPTTTRRKPSEIPKMVIPLKASKPVVDWTKCWFLVYGPPKVGKSQFTSKFPGLLIADVEDGLKAIKARKVPIHSWLEFIGFLDALEKLPPKEKPKMVSIDTYSMLFYMCRDQVCIDNKLAHPGDEGHGKGWDKIFMEMQMQLKRIAALNIGALFLMHSKIETIESRSSKINRTIPDLPATGTRAVKPLCDFILYCGFETATKKGGTKERRVIYTMPQEVLEAGCRWDLPETIPLDFKEFEKALTATLKGA